LITIILIEKTKEELIQDQRLLTEVVEIMDLVITVKVEDFIEYKKSRKE